jgi:hypothetical protein
MGWFIVLDGVRGPLKGALFTVMSRAPPQWPLEIGGRLRAQLAARALGPIVRKIRSAEPTRARVEKYA